MTSSNVGKGKSDSLEVFIGSIAGVICGFGHYLCGISFFILAMLLYGYAINWGIKIYDQQ